jgi:uncharacterized membrane protein
MTERHYPGEDKHIDVPSFEDTDLTRNEYIAALVHFYRGELHRATLWRMRLDNTTNWSIISVMGLITFSLGEPSHSHVGILAGMVLVLTFLNIEARRFRFFDVWRARTRMLEENFMGPILRRDMQSPISNWGDLVAEDLLHPSFKVTFHQAMRARLLRNYVPLFSILLVAWFLKLFIHHPVGEPGPYLTEAMRVGDSPWWVSAVFVACLYLYLLGVILFAPRAASPEIEYWGRSSRQERLSDLDI